jgi:hypothetical protein
LDNQDQGLSKMLEVELEIMLLDLEEAELVD